MLPCTALTVPAPWCKLSVTRRGAAAAKSLAKEFSVCFKPDADPELFTAHDRVLFGNQ